MNASWGRLGSRVGLRGVVLGAFLGSLGAPENPAKEPRARRKTPRARAGSTRHQPFGLLFLLPVYLALLLLPPLITAAATATSSSAATWWG